MNRPPRRCVLILCGALAASGCAGRGDHPPVPPNFTEQVPAPPDSQSVLIWRPGHFDWDGRAYAWVRGEWVERGQTSGLWQDGYWRETGRGSVWVPAHWL